MKHQTKSPVVRGMLVAALLAAAVLTLLFLFTPNPRKPAALEGRPLLEQEGPTFQDTQVGLQFTPPEGWAMQARSTQSPTTHKPDRMLVKYKRLVRGPKVAWLRVSVSDAAPEATAYELAKQRKPRETNWTVTKDAEDGLTVGGQPAARITFGGQLDPDGKGARHCSAEVTVVRWGDQAVVFAGTFTTGDNETRDAIRAAVDSTTFGASAVRR